MEPLTFTVADEAPCDEELQLAPYLFRDISERMWGDLAAGIAVQRTQIPVPAGILARRWEEGYAAAAVSSRGIAAYTSLSPIAEREPGAHSWAAILAGTSLSGLTPPAVSLYEFASSWTDPSWRCKHINITLRLLLFGRFLSDVKHGAMRPDALGLGGMIGLTSSALARLGCRILAWDAAQFVTSLIAVPASEFPLQAALGWRPPEGLKLYQGPDVPLDDPHHRWEHFIHCWVTDPDLAVKLDCELSAMLRGDLQSWRSAIVAAFTRPASLHRLAFLPAASAA